MDKNQNYVTLTVIALQYTQKTEGVYKDIAKDVETRFYTANYE